ncbi:hypothetical protein D3C76_1820480 [compost metagenome]
MVSAKMIAKIRQRTLLAFAAPACGIASAVGRCREALGRAMVRTSIYYFCGFKRVASWRPVGTIEGPVITV